MWLFSQEVSTFNLKVQLISNLTVSCHSAGTLLETPHAFAVSLLIWQVFIYSLNMAGKFTANFARGE